MANFKFQKSALVISCMAALVALVVPQAQAANDVGELGVKGQVSNTTCLLSLGDPASTNNNSKTLNMGTYPLAMAQVVVGTLIGPPQTVILSVKSAADGVSACNLGAAKWDVGISVDPANYENIGGATVLKNTVAAGGSKGFSVRLSTSTGAAVTAGANAVNFASFNPSYGTLLSGSTVSGPTLSATDLIAVTAQAVKNNDLAVAGVFSHSIPLNVWYK